MQNGWSYTRDTNDFINTIKNLKKTQPGNSILVKPDFVGLCPNIPHESSLNAIKEALENRERKSVSTKNILQIKKGNLSLLRTYFK